MTTYLNDQTPVQPQARLTPWSAAHYAPMVTGIGAAKLASSGVAPLVAFARGYETVEPEQVRSFAKHHELGAANTKQHRQLAIVASRGSALVIPWFRADQVASAHTAGGTPAQTTLQLRPGQPQENPATGKLAKYVNLTGSESVIDTNPGTPAEWFTSSPRILITEGVLKGDSALTALLRANGVTDEELEVPRNANVTTAIQSLHALMLRVPPMHRVTILSFVGVGNWKGNDVWVSLKLRSRELLLAFDGDIATNYNVWMQANSLWAFAKTRDAVIKLVDLNVADTNFAEPGDETDTATKIGLDDYLTLHGDWPALLTRLGSFLPEMPEPTEVNLPLGTWKVADDGNSVSEYTTGPAGIDGRPGRPSWQVRTKIGGRVAYVDTHRGPTEQESRTAVFGAGLEFGDVPAYSSCSIELQWINEWGAQEKATVTGPAAILGYPPAEWHRRNAELPNNLLLNPEWPPAKGASWLSAIKDNNVVPPVHRVSWATMGWVPSSVSPVCSFISGRTIVVLDPADRGHTLAGVTETVLADSSGFSLPDTAPVMTEEWKRQVTQDLDTLLEFYIVNSPWSDPQVAAVVLAAAFRPTVPLHCSVAILAQGPPGGGKSETMAQILAFHQEEPRWHNKKLPGSTKDTAASVELALSRANIWVVDDLAPSPSHSQSDGEQAKLGDIIRSVHNGGSKRRAGPDMKAAEVFKPRALLLITAENEMGIHSVRDRLIILRIDKKSFVSERIELMPMFHEESRAPGRLTAACVQILQHMASETSWESMVSGLKDIQNEYRAVAKTLMNEGARTPGPRHVQMAAELAVGFAPLKFLAEAVGHSAMSALLDTSVGGSLPELIARITQVSHQAQKEVTPGRALLDSIRNLLDAGYGHILDASDASSPPGVNGTAEINVKLGWKPDALGVLRPQGPSIGYLTAATTKSPFDVLMLHTDNAFIEAQKRYRAALPPGTAAKSAWEAVWTEGLVHPHYLALGKEEGTRINRAFYIDGHQQRGVPVHLNDIIGWPFNHEAVVETKFDDF